MCPPACRSDSGIAPKSTSWRRRGAAFPSNAACHRWHKSRFTPTLPPPLQRTVVRGSRARPVPSRHDPPPRQSPLTPGLFLEPFPPPRPPPPLSPTLTCVVACFLRATRVCARVRSALSHRTIPHHPTLIAGVAATGGRDHFSTHRLRCRQAHRGTRTSRRARPSACPP